MKIKRLSCFLLAIILCMLTLTGCGNNKVRSGLWVCDKTMMPENGYLFDIKNDKNVYVFLEISNENRTSAGVTCVGKGQINADGSLVITELSDYTSTVLNLDLGDKKENNIESLDCGYIYSINGKSMIYKQEDGTTLAYTRVKKFTPYRKMVQKAVNNYLSGK